MDVSKKTEAESSQNRSNFHWLQANATTSTREHYSNIWQWTHRYLEPVSSIKYLGAFLDNKLSMTQQVTAVCRKAMMNITRIRLLCPMLDQALTKVLVQSLVISHLDFNNCLLVVLPKHVLQRLQRVQNCAARVIHGNGLSCTASITKLRKDLHWLPIAQRIDFKVLVLVFKSLRGDAPQYLQDMFHKRVQHCKRHNVDDPLLVVPFTSHKTFADRALGVYGPKLWNSLTTGERNALTLSEFKSMVKTRLFLEAYYA